MKCMMMIIIKAQRSRSDFIYIFNMLKYLVIQTRFMYISFSFVYLIYTDIHAQAKVGNPRKYQYTIDNLSLKLPLLDDYYDLFYNFFSLVIYMHEKGVSISQHCEIRNLHICLTSSSVRTLFKYCTNINLHTLRPQKKEKI